MNYTFKPEDVVVTSFSSKPNGFIQRVDQGIKVIHLPTGKVITCEEHRSQPRNRATCLEELEKWLIAQPEAEGGVCEVQDDYLAKILSKANTSDGSKVITLPDKVGTVDEFKQWIDELD